MEMYKGPSLFYIAERVRRLYQGSASLPSLNYNTKHRYILTLPLDLIPVIDAYYSLFG